MSSSYSLLLPCHLFACHAFHIMSSCASHLHTCLSHASKHFPRCPFCNPALLRPPAPPFASFGVQVLNILEMYRDLPSGLGTSPVDLKEICPRGNNKVIIYFLGFGLYLRVLLLLLSCISYHVIMCIAFSYVFISCIRAFSPLCVLHSGAPFSSGGHFYLSFVCGD